MKNENGLTGYPSIDKPWNNYYNINELAEIERTVYQELVKNNFSFPNDLAIEFFGSKINYDKFFKNINNTAKAFEEYGVKKGSFVTICAAGIPETVYSFYALAKIGAISNMIAPHFDKNDLIKRIEDCESDILIVMDKFYDEIKDAIKKSRIKTIVLLPTLNSSILRFVSKKYELEDFNRELYWNDFIKDGSTRKETNIINYEKNMPLVMVYSSGTTGASKGILLSNDSFQNSRNAYLISGIEVLRGKKFYQIIPPWYSTGISTSINLPLSCGSAVFMDPRFERDIFIKNIINHKPNYTIAPTSMYEGFLDENLIKGKDLSYFSYPFEGGEPLRKEIAEKIEKVFENHGSTAKLRVGYGQCECGATVTTETAKTEHASGSVGIPLPGITIGIFDEDFNELSYYERGQILANTNSRMIEYYNNPKGTSEYFHIDKNGTKWNCTGDMGYIDKEGHLFVQGRSSDYTIINGKKIFNFDIENVIMQCEGIKICDVLSKENAEGTNSLVAHLIFEDDYSKKINENVLALNIELKKIQEKIFEHFNDINMVPQIFKIRSEFPYAKSGKRDIEKLKNEVEGFIELGEYNPNDITKKLSM